MSMFWTCFSAYCLGWLVMNIFAANMVSRAQGNDPESKRRRKEMADIIADRMCDYLATQPGKRQGD